MPSREAKMSTRFSGRLDQRGAALVLVAISLVVLISAAALAVDVGLLTTARTEAQRTPEPQR